MRRIAAVGAVLLGIVALAGCGGDDSSSDAASTETVATLPTETETTPTETTPAETTPAETSTTPAKPKPTTITIRVVGGVPQGGIARPTLEKGDRAVIVVRTDAGEEIHMHGYDVERTVTPGKPVRLPFTATIPGRFEVELHHPDTLLAVVTVKP
jgi:ABC-type glycerol-3-phosphate transport system substrate-binding protein